MGSEDLTFQDFMNNKVQPMSVLPLEKKYEGVYSPHGLTEAEFFLISLFTRPDVVIEGRRNLIRIKDWVNKDKNSLRLDIDDLWLAYEHFFKQPRAMHFRGNKAQSKQDMLQQFIDADLLAEPGSCIREEYLILKEKNDLIFANLIRFVEFIGWIEWQTYAATN